MASRVRKVGSWEGGDKSSANFEDARKHKDSGRPEVTQNEHLVNQDNARSIQEHCAKVPKFGEWNDGESTVGSGMSSPLNFGRAPLIRDFVADRARPLPSIDDDAYGGGNSQIERDMIKLGAAEVSTPVVQLPVHLVGMPKQKPTHRVIRTVNVTGKASIVPCLFIYICLDYRKW